MDESIIQYEFTTEAIETYEGILTDLLSKWLREENKLDVLVSSFAFDGYGTITIDCYFSKESVGKAKDLANEFFDRLCIDYKLIE